jgi:hypothetical protein
MIAGPFLMVLVAWGAAVGTAWLSLPLLLLSAMSPDAFNPQVTLVLSVVAGMLSVVFLLALVLFCQQSLAMPKSIWIAMSATLAGAWAGLGGPLFGWASQDLQILLPITVGFFVACLIALLLGAAGGRGRDWTAPNRRNT